MSKNIKSILIAAAAALLCCSCSDFLTTPPVDSLSSDGFYSTPGQIEQGIYGVYSDLRYVTEYEYLYLSENRSDNVWSNPVTNGLRENIEVALFRAATDNWIFNSTWNTWYALIFNANTVLSKIESVEFSSEAMKKQFTGELKFLRGWAYFELARVFGNVPAITEPIAVSAVKQVKQSSASDIINNVVLPDLKDAYSLLPMQSAIVDATGTALAASYGRADKVAAAAMLARVYMTLYGNPFKDSSAKAEAKKYLDEVLGYTNQYWAPDIAAWKKQFLPTQYNTYTIFAIQHRDGTGNTAIFSTSKALTSKYTTIRIFGYDCYVEKTLAYEFEKVFSNGKRDARGVGYTFEEEYEEWEGTPAYKSSTGTFKDDGGIERTANEGDIIIKFLPTLQKLAESGVSFDETAMATTQYYNWPVNHPVLRIEDIMLMRAELCVEDGDIPTAMGYVNKIRERALCDPESTSCSAADALKFIKRERRLELFGEGVRWFDEIRYGEWQQDAINKFNRYTNSGQDVANIKDGRYLSPIPSPQLQAVPGLYTQNPDW